jgi:hypothetical protein
VDDEVDILARAGAPVGPPRPAPACLPESDALRRAVFGIAGRLTAEELTPYAAWLSAFHHHWPTRFHALFGARGQELRAQLCSAVIDQNRYLKLRRIAVENLAGVL